MDAYEQLREAYAQDVIDLEEFERAVDAMLDGRIYALPAVWAVSEPKTDKPGGILTYRPLLKRG